MSQLITKDSLNLISFYNVLKMFDIGTEICNDFNDLRTITFSIERVGNGFNYDILEVTLKPDSNKNIIAILSDTTRKNRSFHNAISIRNNVEMFYEAFCNSILSEDYSILIVENEGNYITIQLEHYLFNYKKIVRYQNDNGVISKSLEINIPCNYYN